VSAWGDFLEARLALIGMWMDEGRSADEIEDDLGVDPVQIQLLMMTVRDARARIDGKEPKP